MRQIFLGLDLISIAITRSLPSGSGEIQWLRDLFHRKAYLHGLLGVVRKGGGQYHRHTLYGNCYCHILVGLGLCQTHIANAPAIG